MRLMYAVAVPPVFVAFTVNIVRVSSSVAVPVMVPVDVSNASPLGRAGLMVQVTISPAPVNAGASGRSLLTVLLAMLKSSGE